MPFATVALVGYTNAGKSTLMNALTRAGVLVEDKLFATLDPTIRSLRLPNGDKVMIVDTVGFINKIPHSLIEAFKSTLEEVMSADLLLHLVDMAARWLKSRSELSKKCLKKSAPAIFRSIFVPNKIDIASSSHHSNCSKIGQRRGLSDFCRDRRGSGGASQCYRHASRSRQGKVSRCRFQLGKEACCRCCGSAVGVETKFMTMIEIHVTAIVTPKLAGQMRKLCAQPLKSDGDPLGQDAQSTELPHSHSDSDDSFFSGLSFLSSLRRRR